MIDLAIKISNRKILIVKNLVLKIVDINNIYIKII